MLMVVMTMMTMTISWMIIERGEVQRLMAGAAGSNGGCSSQMHA